MALRAAKGDIIFFLDGFDESLYPNEENALIDDLQKRGRILLYDPELIVYRRPRSTLKAFTKMLATYGRGRAEQFRLHPTIGSALNFIPPLFCLYLLILVIVALTNFGHPLTKYFAAPLALFLLAIIVQTIASIPTHGFLRSLSA